MTVAPFVFHEAAISAAPELCLDWLRSLPADICTLICLIISFIKFKSISPQIVAGHCN